MDENIRDNLAALKNKINSIEEKYGKQNNSVTLLAVSKSKTVGDITEAYEYGQRHFGENYLQEAQKKIQKLEEYNIVWHFIGPLQSNKTRLAAEKFDWVHSIDRVNIAERLSKQRPRGMPPLSVCIQLNISKESSKSGIDPAEIDHFLSKLYLLPNINVRGFMGISSLTAGFSEQRKQFRVLYECFSGAQNSGYDLDTLSMGMSGDFEAAIAEGATMIRIGTDIFGIREQ